MYYTISSYLIIVCYPKLTVVTTVMDPNYGLIAEVINSGEWLIWWLFYLYC
jgi:hypothetical protein